MQIRTQVETPAPPRPRKTLAATLVPAQLVAPSRARAFTLIEIMIVVAIMGIVMMMSIPTMGKLWHKAPMIKAIRDISEVLSRARAQAIIAGSPAEVIFHPLDGRMEVSGSVAPAAPQPGNDNFAAYGASQPAPAHSGRSVQLDSSIRIDGLFVNLMEYTKADSARVRFYPNGTCDEMHLILSSDRNEQYGVTLEITTGLATILSGNDLQRLREGSL